METRNIAGQADTAGADLRPLLQRLRPVEVVKGELSKLEFSFIKRGRRWHVVAYYREPVAPDVRSAAREVLQGLQFLADPH